MDSEGASDPSDPMGHPIKDAIRLPHLPLAAWIGDPPGKLPARLEGAGMQGVANRLGDLFARQEHQLVGVLADGGGLLHVHHQGEVVPLPVEDELPLELPSMDGVQADFDISWVVHPPPVAAVVVVVVAVVVVAAAVVGGVVVIIVGVAGVGGGAW